MSRLVPMCAALLSICLAGSHATATDRFPVSLFSGDSPDSSIAHEYDPEPTDAVSDDPEQAFEDRILRLEAEIADLRRRQTADPYTVLNHQLQQQDAGSGGLFGSVEVTFLKPQLSGIPSGFSLVGVTRTISSDYQTGLRYVLGYLSDSGFGVRARFWNFDKEFIYAQPYAPAVFGMRLSAADAEFMLNQRLRHFDLELAGGLRYAKLEYSNEAPTLFGIGVLSFEGVGPTAAIQARRAIGKHGFSLFGNVRGSLLFGDIRNASILVSMPQGQFESEIMTTFENQIGLAWNQSIGSRVHLEIRAAWETQYWMSHAFADDTFGIGSNLGFNGPALTAEVRY